MAPHSPHLVGALVIFFFAHGTWPLCLPTQLRQRAFGGVEELRRDCEKCMRNDANPIWEVHKTCTWDVAHALFEAIDKRQSEEVWFPSCSDELALRRLVGVIRHNAERLGLASVRNSHWPRTPAPRIELIYDETEAGSSSLAQSPAPRIELIYNETDASALSGYDYVQRSTELWVDEVLGRERLCPYTESKSKAAVGLPDVSPGPVEIVVCADGAASVTAQVWRSVADLVTQPETSVATVLIAVPGYDDDFDSFRTMCDELIEASLQAMDATSLVGRAWFHPKYDASKVHDHDERAVKPGHALPAAAVADYVGQYFPTSELSFSEIATFNDLVRQTPHATINLLRRSQLVAAQRAEKKRALSSNNGHKPNSLYARNVVHLAAQAHGRRKSNRQRQEEAQ